MQTEPLAPFLEAMPFTYAFQDFCTVCWRRYVGHWEIIDGRLYLVKVMAHWEDATPVSLEQLFSGYTDKVFAHWFTGIIRCAQGKRLKYVHMGFGSTYEQDLLLYFTRGSLTKKQVRHNTTPEQ